MTALVVFAAASDPRPDDNNVVAGWVGFAVLIALIIAVVFILRSFTKQLKKVDKARDEGVFGEDEKADAHSEDSGTPPSRHQR
jgi:F0F1-type ATP synthase membrane subunit b/b'